MTQTQTPRPQALSPVAEPLSILHVDTEHAWGGGQAQLVELCRYLKQRGHQQLVACPPDAVLRTVLQAEGIAACDLSARNDLDLRAAWRLRRLLRAHDFAIVHFHTARAHSLTPWLPRRRGRAARFVVSRLMDYRPHWRPRVRYLYNRCVDGVIAISQAIVDVLCAVGVDAARVRLIYLGIDCSPFDDIGAQREAVRREWGAMAEDLVIFTAAVLTPRKGHAVLLDAFAQLLREGRRVRWVICGTGPLRETLERRAQELDVARAVTFTGFSAAVPRLLAGADVFVLPSLHEGLGIAAIEAMAAGLPVIASRVGGLAEIVVDGETGILVPAGDAAALAAAIRRVAADPAWAHAAGQRGRTRALARFTSAATAQAVEAYYYELLGRGT